MIHCGHCQGSHQTVNQVRDCSRTSPIPASIRREATWGRTADEADELSIRIFTEQDERDMQRMEAEGDRADTIRDEKAKADFKTLVEGRPTKVDLLKRVIHLLKTRSIPEEARRWENALRNYVAGDPTPYGLHTAIERLEAFPERASRDLNKVMGTPVTQEGLYRLSRKVRLWNGQEYQKEDLFQVVFGKDSTRLYAKLVIFPPEGSEKKRPTLTYVKGMVFQLLPTELVPAEEAQEITRKTGWCVFGHFLTNPKSIARGMGPTCYERYPHLAKNAVAS